MTTPRTMTLPTQTFAAAVERSTLDEAGRSVEVVWSTGRPIRFWDWELGEYELTLGLDPENVDLEFASSGAPLLDAHRNGGVSSVLGVVSKIWVTGSEGRARIRFSEEPEGETAWRKVAEGVVRFVSVGTRLRKLEDRTEEGDPIPRYFAVLHEPLEISLAPIPKDPGAKIAAAETGERLPVSLVSKGDCMKPEASPKSTPAPKPPDAVVMAERERVGTIVELVEKARLEPSYARALIENGTTIDQARTQILDRLAAQGDEIVRRPTVTVGVNESDRRVELGDLMAEGIAARFGQKASQGAQEFVGWPLYRFAEEMLRASGARLTGFGRDRIVEQALHTTSDFPNLLGNVANRMLRAGYEASIGGAQSLARESSAADFRAKTLVQFGEAPELLKVLESGEFKRGTVAEAAESYRIDTYGRVFGVTRQALVNDDLDAFARMVQEFGRAARRFERQFIVDLIAANPNMADGNAVFSAAHGNQAASGGALGVDTLGAARKAMRLQRGVDGTSLIEMTPTHLLVPAALETAAEQILASIAATTVDDANPFANRLQLVVDPRLDAASATAWYVVDADAEGIEYSYLEGSKGVQTFVREGFDVDGIEIKARLDFGAGWIDWRSWYRNAGA